MWRRRDPSEPYWKLAARRGSVIFTIGLVLVLLTRATGFALPGLGPGFMFGGGIVLVIALVSWLSSHSEFSSRQE